MSNKIKFNSILLGLGVSIALFSCNGATSKSTTNQTIAKDSTATSEEVLKEEIANPYAPVDTAQYFALHKKLANGDTTGLWPVLNQPAPANGSILPFKRVVVYYGNLYSKRMGALGEYAPKEMWSKLNAEVKNWEKADPSTPVQAGIHYIAVVAQGDSGKDGKYRFRMPDKQIDSALTIAKMHDAIVFLDIQVALSTIQDELPQLEKYLKLPHVHLGIDPEFSMKTGHKPGTKIGTYDAEDINYVTKYLADLTKENSLPAKILVIHRFTKGMVTNYKNIKLRPEVQIVMHMDGWGEPELKKGTYRHWIREQPVQFTGFKIFYKNDLKKAPNRLMTPEELLKLSPQPIYIQYQ